jgi:glycosyltransferase involved in cell wall biosynthesis
MRQVLIVSHSYSPIVSPRAFRWTAIAEYWAKQGDRVDIICAWKPGLLREEVIKDVYIHRIGGAVSEMLRSRLRNSAAYPNVQDNKSTEIDGLITKQTLTSFTKWVHDQTWKKVYWPDYACLWYFPALKKAKQLLKSCNYDAVISVSHPFTGHLVGLTLKKYYPYCKWIVDIGDPFCFLEYMPTNNQNFYKQLNYTSEKTVFRQANRIAVTTKNTLTKYSDLFPDSANKIHVIPPLLSWDTSDTSQNSIFSRAEPKLRLVFVGTLHKQIRKPDLLLELFTKLLHTHLAERLELHFVGSIDNCQEYFQPYETLLNKQIFCHGKLSRCQAFQAMKEADVLVNIGNEFPYQLPSKVVEYASFGKPVLNLARIAEDSSAEFFKDYPASLCLLGKNAQVNLEQFTKLIQFLEKLPSVNVSQLNSWLEPYCIEAIAEAYKRLF